MVYSAVVEEEAIEESHEENKSAEIRRESAKHLAREENIEAESHHRGNAAGGMETHHQTVR